MKIQIDDLQKTIKIEEKVKLDELFKKLNILFPNETWKEYELETNSVIVGWKDPIIITEPYPIYPIPQPLPWHWWQPTTISYDYLLSNNSSNNCIYNVEY